MSAEPGSISPSINGGPIQYHVVVEGIRALITHRCNPDLYEYMLGLPRGHEHKTQDFPTYSCYWSNDLEGDVPTGQPPTGAVICASTRWIERAMVEAARSYHKDPGSNRRSLKDVAEASICVTSPDGDPEVTPILVPKAGPGVASTAKEYVQTSNWDYLDRTPMVVNGSRIIRYRPAFAAGWRIQFIVESIQPGLITRDLLRKLLDQGLQLKGLGDSRPKYGRANVVSWEMIA